MGWKKWAILWGTSFLVGLYTTFVMQMLWNWFAVGAFHASEVSYWMMFGLVMLVRTVFWKNDSDDEARYKRLVTIMDACIPEDKRGDVRAEVEMEEKSAPVMLGLMILGQVMNNTLTLGLGWAVHVFLA